MLLNSSLLSHFGAKLINKDLFVLFANVTPLPKETLADILQLISDTIKDDQTSKAICLQLAKLTLNILANSTLDDDNFGLFEDILNEIFDDGIIDTKVKASNKEEIQTTHKSFIQNLSERIQELNLEEGKLIGFFLKEQPKLLEIQTDVSKSKKNVEESEKIWLKDLSNIALRINLKKKVRKLLSKKKELKFRDRLLMNPLKTNYPLELLKTQDNKNLQSFLVSCGARLDIFNIIDKYFREVLNYQAKNAIVKAIDFHYISGILLKITEISTDYMNTIRESLVNKDTMNKSNIKEIAKDVLKKLEIVMDEFQRWCDQKVLDVENVLVKKPKISRAKWEEDAITAKLQAIAKKRKGIFKQELQQWQKMRQKFGSKK